MFGIVLIGILALLIVHWNLPHLRYSRAVVREYEMWTGRQAPRDPDFIATIQDMRKLGMTPREARIVLVTYEKEGSVAAMEIQGQILSGSYMGRDSE